MTIPNPFRKYPPRQRASAISAGIVGDAAKAAGASKSAVSRAFGGHSYRTSERIVLALDGWLKANGYQTSEDAQTARNAINELRAKSGK